MQENVPQPPDATRPSARSATRSGELDNVTGQVRRLCDAIEHHRDQRKTRLVEIAGASIEASGLSIGTISDRLVGDILEGGAREDDPDLQALWANLLANALTDAAPVPRAFPALMRQLEPIEARLLSELRLQEARHLPGSWVEFHELTAVEGKVEWRHLDNLERLALLRFETTYPQNVELPDFPPRDTMRMSLLLTPLGHAFLDACQPIAPSRAQGHREVPRPADQS